MGFGDAMGTLVGFARTEFNVSTGMAGLLPFFAILAYGIFSVPTGALADRKGKKFVLVLGLFITLVGELIPAISLSSYLHLLLAVFLIGAGMTALQVAGNPLMREVSAPGKFSRNLTFAQFIKGIGATSAPYAVPLVLALGLKWNAIFSIYSAAVLVTLLGVLPLPIRHRSEREKSPSASVRSSFSLLRERRVLLMVLGVFLYVGAEVGMNSWIATYLHVLFDFDLASLATLGIGFFLTAIMIGRLLGSIILDRIPARKFFLLNSVLALLALLALFLKMQTVSLVSIFLAGMAFGNIFPLIFSMLVESKPERSSELSGLMCMASLGGAVIPLGMGLIAHYSILASFLLPVSSFGFLVYLSIRLPAEG